MLFNYTTELRTFFENNPVLNPDQPLSHRVMIEAGREKLFDFEYPIFDEEYRKIFETHFIRKFYMRQIGFETFGLFKFQLESWLIINMPYFNKIFESELLQFDPLTNMKVDTTYTKNNDKTQNDTRNTTDEKIIDGETNSDSTKTGTATTKENTSLSGNTDSTQTKDETGSVTDDNFDRQLESNNPDSRLELTSTDGQGVIEYASNIKENTENNLKSTVVNGTNTNIETSRINGANDGTTTSNDNLIDTTTSNITQNDTKTDILVSGIKDIEDYVENRVGKIGNDSFSKMLKEYRSTLLRVENEIFNEMNELFMLVY